jgi:hypothetical protein
MMSKNRYRGFVDPASIILYSEEPTEQENTHTHLHARATKRNQVLSVEQLASGCVLIRVEFGQARARDPFVPPREDLSKGRSER